MIAAVVAAFLYLRVLISMFLQEPSADARPIEVPATVGTVLFSAVVVTILFGIFPGLLDGFAQDALVELTNGINGP